jgi:large subunit ribosomal protein L23
MKSSYQIIKSPLLTEKGAYLQEQNKYLFLVDMSANKIEIKKAIEDIYEVHVTKINIIRVKGKLKRVRYKLGRTAERKKAIVTLKQGEKIEFV